MQIHSIRTALVIAAMLLSTTAFGCKSSGAAVSSDLQGLASSASDDDGGVDGDHHHHGDRDKDSDELADEASGNGHHGGSHGGDRDKDSDELADEASGGGHQHGGDRDKDSDELADEGSGGGAGGSSAP